MNTMCLSAAIVFEAVAQAMPTQILPHFSQFGPGIWRDTTQEMEKQRLGLKGVTPD